MLTVDEAQSLAHNLLAADLPRRWSHTQGVATQARQLARVLGSDAALIEAAAWLHDIGYAPTIRATGFHPWTAPATSATPMPPTNSSAAWSPTTPAPCSRPKNAESLT